MSLVAFPVLWKNAQERDLRGIVDLQMAELPVRGAQVKDLFPLLNAKINAHSPIPRHDLEVERLLLYGTQLSRLRTLDALIPELGGSPRFVAIMRAHPRSGTSGRFSVSIKTLTGKRMQLTCHLSDTIGHLKSRIGVKERIAVDKQMLLFAGKRLEDHLTLRSYGIKSHSDLFLVKKVRGGGCPPRIFADLSNNSILTEREFSRDAPEWRILYQGLNIEGRCKNEECEAYQEMVICPKQYEAFNLMEHDNMQCPMCRTNVKPRTCGFYNCLWKYEGTKTNEECSLISPWKEASGEKYHRFDADKKYHSVEWDSLLIVAKPNDEDSTVASPSAMSTVERVWSVTVDEQCTICWCEFGSKKRCVPTTVGCGHSFHKACIKQWVGWCGKSGVLASCPMCRKEVKA